MEERVAILEANVEHIRSDISEIKVDIRKLNDKVDAVDQKLNAKIDGVKDSVANLTLSMEKSFGELRLGRALDRVSTLLMLGALLGIMARAFKWL